MGADWHSRRSHPVTGFQCPVHPMDPTRADMERIDDGDIRRRAKYFLDVDSACKLDLKAGHSLHSSYKGNSGSPG
jgi:hypothetical protein